jgi:hypothetical protein
MAICMSVMQTYQTIAIVAAVVFGLDFTRARSAGWRIGYLIFTAFVTLRGVRTLPGATLPSSQKQRKSYRGG